jgi:diaminohydroxyphosphoribosylaminopyrimidine deaminase/5-amino-6-(5-phosphoribosylamino)uracil reductase
MPLPDLHPDAKRVQDCVERLGRPFVRLKAAATLDGKIATRHGESQWITGEAARSLGRRLRGVADGVLVGIGTALADDPQLTAREAGVRDPARIVLDSTARLPPTARCLATDGARRIVVTGSGAPAGRVAALRATGAEVLSLPTARPEPGAFLPALARLGVRSLLVEGGAQVHGSLIAHLAADELWLFLAGRVMGDASAPAWCAGLEGGDRAEVGSGPQGGLARMPTVRLAPPLTLEGGDLLIRGSFERPHSPEVETTP